MASPGKGAVRLSTPPRPPHPALHVRDDRDTPLGKRGGTAGITNAVSSKRRSEIFFMEGVDRSANQRGAICRSGELQREYVLALSALVEIRARKTVQPHVAQAIVQYSAEITVEDRPRMFESISLK